MKLLPMFAVLLWPRLSFAAAGAHGEHGIGDLFWFWVNFPLFVLFLALLLRQPGRNYWLSRRSRLEEEVNRGEKELRRAEEYLSEVQRRHAGLEAVTEALSASIDKEAHDVQERLLAEARQQGTRLLDQARDSVTQERAAAERSLRQELADYVIHAAETKLRQQIDQSRDRQIREATMRSVKSLL